eukprot:CAMPEP_0170574582 /NCGR_PEP_ID=MMETSP0224-20130122/3378_1 /TAXON_ID=285029 /ORGANISM="Togula jolla, Strain CCCM 725" /LENGTH=189 /DNA_ID=CAMNT_0010897251 /DNA_START=14 /DNA_END=583 /DNA_ORIENTATION=+
MADKLQVLVPIADASEEIETACITDTLTRAGAAVTVASVKENGELQVTMSRGLRILADCGIDECTSKSWDAIVLPGGMPGAERLRDNETLARMLKEQSAQQKVTAAVCASPAVVFSAHGLLPAAATCYPNPKFKELMPGWSEEKTIMDGHIITGQGPGTSLQFALKIVEKLYGKPKAEEIAAAMLTTTA